MCCIVVSGKHVVVVDVINKRMILCLYVILRVNDPIAVSIGELPLGLKCCLLCCVCVCHLQHVTWLDLRMDSFVRSFVRGNCWHGIELAIG